MPKDLQYSQYIDHTVLKADTLTEKIDQFCKEAMAYHFASVCVNPYWVRHVADRLRGSGVKTAVVVGFPLGANKTAVKVLETVMAIEDGAQEIDMVMNISALKEGRNEYVLNEIRQVVGVAHPNAIVKVIIETSELSQEEIIIASKLVMESGADFVKTSTGFGSGGATIEDVALIKSVVGDKCQIKASTGINNRLICDQMLHAGATRFGTSKGIMIVEDLIPEQAKGY